MNLKNFLKIFSRFLWILLGFGCLTMATLNAISLTANPEDVINFARSSSWISIAFWVIAFLLITAISLEDFFDDRKRKN